MIDTDDNDRTSETHRTLSTTEQALRDSEARYQTLFNSVDEGICIVEVIFGEDDQAIDYRFLETNPTFEQQTGLVDAVGKTARELVPDLEDFWFEIYGRVASIGKPERFENHAEAMGRWFDVNAVRVGEPHHHQVALFFSDITERKRSEQALREADERKDQFMAVLSHELRNPLAPIKLSLEMLDFDAAQDSNARRAREIIERQVDQLTALIDDLLDVTRLNSQKIKLLHETFDLGELIEHVVADHRMLFESRNIDLQLGRSPAPLFVHADRSRLSQVLGNLLQNAAKFTEPGGHTHVTLSSVLGTPTEGNQAEVRVTDDGIGMTAETLADLFEPFIQADTSLDHSKGGLGLGLALVKGLIDQHEGDIEVSSDGLGHGSEFVVRLPLVSSEAACSKPTNAPLQDQLDDLASRRVLVIEDNVDVANALATALRLAGHQVDIASDGEQGVQLAQEVAPEVVFCDIGLPGRDGYSVARSLREIPELRSTVLVALSGYAMPEDVNKSYDAGFDQHIAKPPKLSSLEEVLSTAPRAPRPSAR
jgi:PAS domain S-box-containing protein